MLISRKLLDKIMGTLEEGLVVLSLDPQAPGAVAYINKQFKSIFGYGISELQDKVSAPLGKLCDDNVAIARITKAIKNRTPITTDIRCLRKNGQYFECRVTINYVEKPDGINDYAVIRSRDISEEVEKVQALEESNLSLISRNTKLEKMATHDELTSLYNRRFFNSQIGRIFGFHSRHKMPICIAFIDIDYYKDYNDSYGHIAGDQVLRLVAREMTKIFLRLEDITARYGGDEFVIVSSCATDRDATFSHFEALRKRIESLAIPNVNSPCDGIVTLSIGVYVEVPEDNTTETDILNAADQALYAAKTLGRNRVEVYTEGFEYSEAGPLVS